MKNAKVICEKCNGVVESGEDLVTTTLFLPVVAYHEDCFVDHLKGSRGFILSGVPINGLYSNITTILCVILAIISLVFFESMAILFFASLIPISYRLYSYFIYERPLKNLDNH